MRLKDLTDYLALRRHLERPWDLIRLRGRPGSGEVIEVPLRGGRVVRIRAGTMDRHILHRIFGRDEYSLDAMGSAPLGTVIDVGAHIGLFALRAAPLAERIVCCEPSPANLPLLRANVEGLEQVAVLEAAVAGASGARSFRAAGDPASHGLVQGDGAAAEAISIRSMTLEELLETHRVDRCGLLKLDCEGAEYEVLLEAPSRVLARIERVSMEYHAVPGAPPGWTGAALAAVLERSGHRVRLAPSRTPGRGHIHSMRPR